MNTLLAARISWHLGTQEKQFFVVGATLFIILSSIPSLYLLDASNPLPTHDNQICLKTLPISPGGQGKEAQNYSQN